MLSKRSILAASFVAGAAAAAEPSAHDRPPLQTDFDLCVLRVADSGNENIQGRLRLQLLLRSSGNVFAAFVHSENGVDDRRLERCLTSKAVLWKFPPAALDYSRAYELTFIPGGTSLDLGDPLYHQGQHFAGYGRASVFMPDINDPPHDAPFNVQAAQDTLDVAEWASSAERAIAAIEVHKYGDAIEASRQALRENETDPLALRALAVALAESRQGIGEARVVGERLVAFEPQSEASHEALLRVCIAAGDDPCIYQQFAAARNAPDVAPRSRQLAALQPAAEKAAARLRAQAQDGGRCATANNERDRVLCVVRRCLDSGTAALAQELSGQKGARYDAQDWRVERVGDGRMVVARPLSSATERREPRWLVKIGERTVTMSPTNADARHVTVDHPVCGVVRSQGIDAKDVARSPAIEEKLEKLVQKK